MHLYLAFQSYSPDAEDAWQTELEEREENFGWTADEHDDLASQGIKPWEREDAEVEISSLFEALPVCELTLSARQAYLAFDPRRSP